MWLDILKRQARNTTTLAAAAAAVAAYVPGPPRVNVVRAADATESTDPTTETITLGPSADAFARAHAVGHLLDHQILTDGDRTYFQKLMKAPAGAWRTGTGTTGGHSSPSEWFADYFATAATGGLKKGHVDSSYANIGPVRAARFDAALARIGKRYNLQPYRDPGA